MNKQIDDLMYSAGLTAQGCWDEMDAYDKQAIEKFAELIVKECAKVLEIQGSNTGHEQYHYGASLIEEHFGVKE